MYFVTYYFSSTISCIMHALILIARMNARVILMINIDFYLNILSRRNHGEL